MEVVDVVVVNKADLMPQAASQVRNHYTHALQLRPHSQVVWKVPVVLVSSTTGSGIAEVIEAVEAYKAEACRTGNFVEKRKSQSAFWLWKCFNKALISKVSESEKLRNQALALQKQVDLNALSVRAAAAKLVESLNI
jgi:LAO/AO transport system kinase